MSPVDTLDRRRTAASVNWYGSRYAAISRFDPACSYSKAPIAVFKPSSELLSRAGRRREENIWTAFVMHLNVDRSHSMLMPRSRFEHSDPAPLLAVSDGQIDRAKPRSLFVAIGRKTVTCEVEEILADSFTALYWDPVRGRRRAGFLLEALPAEDRPLVRPRAQFHWSVGREDKEDGSRHTTSILHFKTLPELSEAQWQEALQAGRDMLVSLGVEPLSQTEMTQIEELEDKDDDD